MSLKAGWEMERGGWLTQIPLVLTLEVVRWDLGAFWSPSPAWKDGGLGAGWLTASWVSPLPTFGPGRHGGLNSGVWATPGSPSMFAMWSVPVQQEEEPYPPGSEQRVEVGDQVPSSQVHGLSVSGEQVYLCLSSQPFPWPWPVGRVPPVGPVAVLCCSAGAWRLIEGHPLCLEPWALGWLLLAVHAVPIVGCLWVRWMPPCRERAGEKPHPLLFLQASGLQPELVLPHSSSAFWATDIPPASSRLPVAQGDSVMTIIRVSAERGGGSEWRVAPPAPGPLVGQQPVTAPRQRSPGGRGALESREPRGQAQRTEGGTGGREPPSSPPLLLFLNPGLLLTSSALIINGLTTLGQARQLKIKRKTGKHCLLTMLLIGGVNFNGLTGAWEGGFQNWGSCCSPQ